METTSYNSPKNKFRVELRYSKPLKGIGSICSATANEVSSLKSWIQFHIDQAHRNGATCTVVISENMKQYPQFEWKEIENYKA